MLPEPQRLVETGLDNDGRVNAFFRRFGQAHLDYAAHAAFPLVLTPDLCYQIWATFRVDSDGAALRVPWIAVADLLLSDLCKESDQEVFEMAAPARAVLISRLRRDQRFGPQRLSALARYLASYAERQLLRQDPDGRRIGQVQRWVALSYIQPDKAARELAQALSEAYPKDKPEAVRLATVVSALQEPLTGFQPLLAYSKGVMKLVQGDEKAAGEAFAPLIGGHEHKTEVLGVRLPLPDEITSKHPLKPLTHREPTQQAAEAPKKIERSEERKPFPSDKLPPRTREQTDWASAWTQAPYGALIIGLGGIGVNVLQHIKTQLLGGEARDLPPNVKMFALDTVQDQENPGDEESILKGITLKTGEYFWIGGDVYDYVVEVSRGRHPHIGSWLQADTYLKTLPRAAFTLQKGAGQLRQFGRLAIFRDVQAPTVSHIARLLDEAMREIPGVHTNLGVYLVASTAGGTGAGMFVDIAYLVRKLAEIHHTGLRVRLRGFLVLPEAFSFIPGGANDNMKARSYAEMRENRRFMADLTWKTGYPMYYQASGTGGVWHSEIKTRLFDSLYYIDGQRAHYPLTGTLPKFGVTASIGDAIVAMLDDSENKYGEQHLNIVAARGRTSNTSNETALNSAIGTYSMILPMREIIESLAYRLLQQALDALCVPATRDEDGYVLTLRPDQNNEAGEGKRGRDAAADFLRAGEIKALDSDERVVTTLLPAEILRYAAPHNAPNQPLIMELAAKSVSDWEYILDPTGDTPDVWALRDRVRHDIQMDLLQIVQPKLAGESARDSVVRLPRQIDLFKVENLGIQDPRTGQHSGGRYRLALEQYANKHVARFKDALQLEIMNILNGSPRENGRVARGGKLPYLEDMLEGLDELFGRFIQALDATHLFREQQGLQTALVGSARMARQSMEQNPSNFLFQRGRTEAYIRAENELINFIKSLVVESLLRTSVLQMQDHVKMLRASVDSWITTLATGHESLYGYILRGQRRLNEVLKEQSQVKVRRMLPATDTERNAYLDELMNRYAVDLQDGLSNFLRDLNWRYDRQRRGGREIPTVTLSIAMAAAENEQGQWRNLEVFLDRSRKVFYDAWQQESILRHLMEVYRRPEALAQELVDNGGPLLATKGGQPTPANYLHIWVGNDKQEIAYLEGVKLALTRLSGASGRLSQVIQSTDRFSCRLVSTLDLIPLESVQSYNTSRSAYYNYSRLAENRQVTGSLGRETLHLFPAEVNAARYEARIPIELNLPVRELDTDVVLQLENIERFCQFVRAWAYGVIFRDEEQQGDYYALRLPADEHRDSFFEKSEVKYYLSTPQKGRPDILQALATFQYVGQDIRSDVREPIPYGRMLNGIEQAKMAQIDKRLRETLVTEPNVRQRMQRMSEGDQVKTNRLLADREILRERQTEVRRLWVDVNNPRPVRDLAAVFWLTLEDEVKMVQNAILQLG